MFLTAIVNSIKAASRGAQFFRSLDANMNDFAVALSRIAWQTEKIGYTLEEREGFAPELVRAGETL